MATDEIRDLTWDDIFSADPKAGDLRLDFCRYGTAWRKRTRFRCNLEVAGQRVFCTCKSPHVVLRGRCREKGVNGGFWTLRAVPKLLTDGLVKQTTRGHGGCLTGCTGEQLTCPALSSLNLPPLRSVQELGIDLLHGQMLPLEMGLLSSGWLTALHFSCSSWLLQGRESLHLYRQFLAHVRREHPALRLFVYSVDGGH